MKDTMDSFEQSKQAAKIRVVGVGGAGCNAVNTMIANALDRVDFIACNTDIQALQANKASTRLQIGAQLTRGLGAGANPEMGRQAATESRDMIAKALEGADMVFVTAGMGGGTGTGAAPVIADIAKSLGALTVGVVTKPFGFEGKRRMKLADNGLGDLASTVDTVIAIPNDRLLSLAPRGASFFDSFRIADDLLRQAVQGISDIIVTPGLINRDFSDIKSIMSGMGYAMMGTATAKGENAAVEAARQAINSPLLEDSRIRGSRGILINITGSSRLGLHEVNEACCIIREAADCDDVMINFGVILNESLEDAVKVTVIATGFQPVNEPMPTRPRSVVESRPLAVVAPAPVEIPEPEYVEPAASEPPAPPPAAHAPQARPLPPKVANGYDSDDLDTPAYLRQGKLLN